MEHTRRSFLHKSISGTVAAALYSTVSVGGFSGVSSAHANTPEAVALRGFGTNEALWQRQSEVKHGRRLRMINVHTNEKISVVYRKDGKYIADALKQINFLLRDYRANEVMKIDSHTIDYLYSIYAMMNTDEYIQILSGYRSPATNEMLRKRSPNVAKNSLHIAGKAVDFRIPGRETKALQLAALDLKLGGIGYYGKSDFVHIDSGRFRHWE